MSHEDTGNALSSLIIIYMDPNDRPQPYILKPAGCPRDQEQARIKRSNDRQWQIKLWYSEYWTEHCFVSLHIVVSQYKKI